MLVNLTKWRPALADTPPADAKHILLFDATYAGYKDAAAWIAKNRHRTHVYRLVIPYAETFDDVGDYVCAQSTLPVLASEDMFDNERSFTYKQVSFDDLGDDVWPCPSKQRYGDFVASAEYLRSRLMLRDMYTGLNAVQQYMKDHQGKLPLEELKAACSLHFKLPFSDVRQQADKLTHGNLPEYNLKTDVAYLPLALINGPFPLAPRAVCEGILGMERFRTGTVDWAAMTPSCPGYIFTKNQAGQWMSTYGQYVADKPNLAPYGKPPLRELAPAQVVAWDPEFLQGNFDINSYMTRWVDHTLSVRLLAELKRLLEQEDYMYLERTVISSLVNRSTWIDGDGITKLVFLNESRAMMEHRIETYFSGRMTLLDLPLRRFNADYLTDNLVRPPECTRDMLRSGLRAILETL